MIADLKPYPAMKDSGVEWLGEVPEHWEVRTVRSDAEASERNGGIPPNKCLSDDHKGNCHPSANTFGSQSFRRRRGYQDNRRFGAYFCLPHWETRCGFEGEIGVSDSSRRTRESRRILFR